LLILNQMNVMAELEDLQEYYSHPPGNEWQTCECVIRPVIKMMGYSAKQVRSQLSDENHKLPDYTISPHEGLTWFLEAKAWKIGLQDNEIHQALNYANQNGRRWVVLSNGQEWRLYDNDVRGIPRDKLAALIELQQVEPMAEFIAALSPSGFESHLIDKFAATQRERRETARILQELAHSLNAALGSRDSNVVVAITDSLTGSINGLKPEHVVSYFAGRSQPSDGQIATEPSNSVTPAAVANNQTESVTKSWNLDQQACRVALEQLVRGTPRLVVDSTFKRGVLFCPESWESIPKGSVEWSKAGRVVLITFEVDNWKPGIITSVCIGPGDPALRAKIFDAALRHPILKPASGKVVPSQKWDTVYRHNFLLGKYGTRPFEELREALAREWQDFVRDQLPGIERAVLDGALS
jgi:predicted type IV restriction endonuclease